MPWRRPTFRLTGRLPPPATSGGGPMRGQPDVLFDYTLASHLHMSVDAVRRFPNGQWIEWAAFLRFKSDQEEAAMKRAQRKGGRGR